MSVAGFLTDLFESGRVKVASEPLAELGVEVDPILESAERIAALNFPGAAPAFSLPTARWATLTIYRACHLIVCRDLDERTLKNWLREPCSCAVTPETSYSADLLFQYLPDVIAMTRALSSGDPLLQELLRLAREWPLSSVDVSDLGPVRTDAFIGHPGLRQLYADRIIARRDTSRLGDTRVENTVRQALGAYPELCRDISNYLAKVAAEHQDQPATAGS